MTDVYEKEKETRRLRDLSDKQKEFYYLLKDKNIEAISEWIKMYGAYPTIQTFRILGLVNYADDIYYNEKFLQKLNESFEVVRK